jgi:hypothetical protein
MTDPMAKFVEGYKCYREWAEAMARAGQPLPPGGTLLINRTSVFVSRLLDLRQVIADELRVDLACVVIDVDTHPITGRLTPKVEIDLPDGGDLTEAHARGVIKTFYERFQADVNARLDSLARSDRTDLEYEVAVEATDGGRDQDPAPPE